MEKKKTNKRSLLRFATGVGIFSALAYVVSVICSVIPKVAGFLSIDAKDAVIAIASFVYGPVAAIILAFIPSLIELVSVSGTGFWGFVMNFASSACFGFTASIIYKYKRSLNGAIIGLLAAVISTTALMMLLNLFITPIYFGVSREEVISILPSILLPFNFAKSLMNAAITMLIYKPVSAALKSAHLIDGKLDLRFNRQSVIMLVVGNVLLIVAIVIFIILNL